MPYKSQTINKSNDKESFKENFDIYAVRSVSILEKITLSVFNRSNFCKEFIKK